MPATMFAAVRENGYGKEQLVTLPYVGALLQEQEIPKRYFILPPAEPEPVSRGTGRGQGGWGARPRSLGQAGPRIGITSSARGRLALDGTLVSGVEEPAIPEWIGPAARAKSRHARRDIPRINVRPRLTFLGRKL